ncbi:MAG TPA: response regulator [Anaerolineae bacterium]|nr:response regulator [Anaerolineae bacterium]
MNESLTSGADDTPQVMPLINYLDKIAHLFSQNNDFFTLLPLLITQLKQHLPITHALFATPSATHHHYTLHPITTTTSPTTPIPITHGLAGHAFTHHTPAILTHPPATPDPAFPHQNYPSILAFPLISNNQTTAVLLLAHTTPQAYHQNNLVWLTSLATPLALAFNHKQTQQQLQQEHLSRQQLEQQLTTQQNHLEELVATRTAQLTQAKEAAEAANRTKSTFLANMSHELRTPLTVIIGYAEMLAEQTNDTYTIDKLNKIHLSAKQLLSIISDILDLSKIEAGEMILHLEPVPLKPLIEHIITTLQPLIDNNNNQISWSITNTIDTLHADAQKLKQIISNLLNNAAKFTHDGHITMTITQEASNTVTNEQDWLKIEIKDTGIGIPSAKMNRLFRAFAQIDDSTTREYGGTGLGLVISRRLCQLMGGDLTVASQPDHGSIFTIYLPTNITSQQHPSLHRLQHLPDPNQNDNHNNTILIIDDDPNARHLISQHLHNAGYQVLIADTGREGLHLAATHHPLAITLDALLPDMTGWQLLTTLKNDPALTHIPVVMLTVMEDRQTGLDLGATDYLHKPIDYDRLATVITQHSSPQIGDILLVEDNQDLRHIVTKMLTKQGWQVRTATNGYEALTTLQQATPALILLDLMMPEMDGFQFMNHVRQNPYWANIPIIIITAKKLSPQEKEQIEQQTQQLLQKGSFHTDELLSQVTQLINQLNDTL